MKKKVRKLLLWVLPVAMLVFLALTGYQAWGSHHTKQTTRQAMELAGVDPDMDIPLVPTAPSGIQTQSPATTAPAEDFSAVAAKQSEPLDQEAMFLLYVELEPLQQVNDDVLGWICIPGTQVSYPLMQGQDNQHYLKHAWDNSRSSAGSIFMECRNDPRLLDFNTIVYGHHMVNGACFAQVMDYRDEDFFRENPYIYIVTQGDLRRYQVFAAYEAPIDSQTYRIRISGDAKKQAALDEYVQSSLHESDLIPGPDSYVLTLSTCIGNGRYDTRFVVQAVLTGIWMR